MANEIALHGFTAVPRAASKVPEIQNSQPAQPIKAEAIEEPSSNIAKAIRAYAEAKLPGQTFSHSMRVFYFGEIMRQQHFAAWKFSSETWFLACLLHDIGTTDENLHATLLSFEWYGGMMALDLLKSHGSEQAQRESVAEAIFRHQDVGEVGTITALGQLLQLATIFDNMGGHEKLLHRDTIESVVHQYPRNGWSKCFSQTIRQENGLKPWAHTTALGEEDFPEGVLHNKLMERYD